MAHRATEPHLIYNNSSVLRMCILGVTPSNSGALRSALPVDHVRVAKKTYAVSSETNPSVQNMELRN